MRFLASVLLIGAMLCTASMSRLYAQTCGGDCNADGEVTVDEIVFAVNIALGAAPVASCTAVDLDGDGQVTIDELIRAVSHAVDGCPAPVVCTPPACGAGTVIYCPGNCPGGCGSICVTPTPTATPTATPTPTNAGWAPSIVYRAPHEAAPRGWLDVRGLIHAHSVYSHDACDGEPVKNGQRDPVCLADFRSAVCTTKHDFVMLTDHKDSYAEYEFPEVLLYSEERGDELIYRDGNPVASWAACPDQSRSLILAGTESALMPVGMERHVPGTIEDRRNVYGEKTVEAGLAELATDAVLLVSHTEDWTVDQLIDLPLHGFEMYNIHANLMRSPGAGLELLMRVGQNDPTLGHPDLALLSLITEDSRYLKRWGGVLSRGVKRVTTMATDCHQNTFPQLMSDGERIDSYRRLMLWYSNHLLIRTEEDGSWNDRSLKEALAAGRLYGAFELMGYPEGFDYRAETGEGIGEMGDEIALSDNPTLVVDPPAVQNLDPVRPKPELTVRILKAVANGFEVVASGPGQIRYTPVEPGAYRAEVRMRPLHLREYMNADAETLLAPGKDFVWIYANPIYIR